MRDYSLVTSVVQCSACSLTDDFKGRIGTQSRRYPQIWQGYVRNGTASPQMVAPLYTVATPWVWYQGDMDREVATEHQDIRNRFSIIKNYPPAHLREFREEAVEFFKAKFGVKHLESLVQNVSSSSDPLRPLQESRGKELVLVLVEAMRGVTHRRGDKWLSAVKDLVRRVQKTADTLALQFLGDICNSFPREEETLDSFIKGRKSNYNIVEHIRPLVKRVEELHDRYYAIEDPSEKLALEEDIVGKILEAFRFGISLEIQHVLVKESWVVNEILHYETTDGSMDLPEKEVRFKVPHDSVAHLRRLMANAREGVSMYDLYRKAREERRDGGIGDEWLQIVQDTHSGDMA
ncbi:hypothetical protein EV401DRAFT_1997216 [Pisolithus croceorrhizus]|nr:hypothetical protein EV401DRAFT_1997216 [Pisolithus croceorrhizus]